MNNLVLLLRPSSVWIFTSSVSGMRDDSNGWKAKQWGPKLRATRDQQPSSVLQNEPRNLQKNSGEKWVQGLKMLEEHCEL
jgi:hypothetical protein